MNHFVQMDIISKITIADILEFTGTFAFAVSGIRMAATKKFDWFGALVVGFVTAVGGGTLRDLMLGITPFWMLNPLYIVTSLLALLIALINQKIIVKFHYTFFTFDTIGLALFTVVGIEKTLHAGFPFWVAIIMGTITGSAGGMMRDVLINEIPLIFRKEIYALACIAGGIIYWLAAVAGLPATLGQLLAIVAVIVVRIIAVKYHIGLPTISLHQHN